MDAANRLFGNKKLVARAVVCGRFCDTNEPIELDGRSIIYPASEQEKMGIHLSIGYNN